MGAEGCRDEEDDEPSSARRHGCPALLAPTQAKQLRDDGDRMNCDSVKRVHDRVYSAVGSGGLQGEATGTGRAKFEMISFFVVREVDAWA